MYFFEGLYRQNRQTKPTRKEANMAKINYTAVKGSNTMGSKPFYIGIVQYGRVMSKKETYPSPMHL